jgi:hypothetical protein
VTAPRLTFRLIGIVAILGLTACSDNESAFCSGAKELLEDGPDGQELVDALRRVDQGGLMASDRAGWLDALDEMESRITPDGQWTSQPASDFVSEKCGGAPGRASASP